MHMPASGTITRVAGIPLPPDFSKPGPPPEIDDSGDDGPAVDAQLSNPVGLAVTADGGFLIATGPVVRKVSSSGTITLVAGTGKRGDSGDDGPATQAELYSPAGLAVTDDGGFLIPDASSQVVRRVSATGTITRVAGTGAQGGSGDDGPATSAQLKFPEAVALTPDGGFLIADSGNSVVRKVSPTGIISRVAGTGVHGDSGDDGPATEAQLKSPTALALTPDGGFLIADTNARVVRKVSASGIISRVAGTGTAGYSGDDGPATGAELNAPSGVALTADGGFLIADSSASVVRKVSAAGIITRVAGTGTTGYSGEDGPATEAQLGSPVALAVTADGGFLIADVNNHVIRKVWP
jgi:trimeric autotransporter adhesin